MKKIIQLIGLSLLVVVLPGASWYFLKSGLDYRMDSMDKLGDYGQLPKTELYLNNGKTVNTDRLENKMAIIHTLNTPTDTALIMKLYRQFSKRTDLQFILTDTNTLKLKADRTSNLWLLNEKDGNRSFLTAIGLTEPSKNIALVDSKGEIRNYYNLDNLVELQQMVEHTAFLLPVQETEKPVMQRASEK